MSSVERFAVIAKAFCAWAESTEARPGPQEVATVLRLLAALYAAALELPEGVAPGDEVEDTSDDEWSRVYTRCAALPIDYYHQIIDPLADPAGEPERGLDSLADDIADIHRDLRRGLARYERGETDAAAWEWAFHFRAHWGAHASGALHVLHGWWAKS